MSRRARFFGFNKLQKDQPVMLTGDDFLQVNVAEDMDLDPDDDDLSKHVDNLVNIL